MNYVSLKLGDSHCTHEYVSMKGIFMGVSNESVLASGTLRGGVITGLCLLTEVGSLSFCTLL